MTDAERLQLKEDLKKVIFDHLNSVGYPNMTNQQIMEELPVMWDLIVRKHDLYREGMSFQSFIDQAFHHAMISEILGVARGQQ